MSEELEEARLRYKAAKLHRDFDRVWLKLLKYEKEKGKYSEQIRKSFIRESERKLKEAKERLDQAEGWT